MLAEKSNRAPHEVMLNCRDPVGVDLHRSLTALDLAALDGYARVVRAQQAAPAGGLGG